MTIHGSVRRGLFRLTLAIVASAPVWAGVGTGGIAPASAYEVWLTDQSDTTKESGGFLHIYDGAALAANPATRNRPSRSICPARSTHFAKQRPRNRSGGRICCSSTRTRVM